MFCLSAPPAHPHVHAVKKELEGKDITLLVEGGLKTKEDLGKHCMPPSRLEYDYTGKCFPPRCVALECAQREVLHRNN